MRRTELVCGHLDSINRKRYGRVRKQHTAPVGDGKVIAGLPEELPGWACLMLGVLGVNISEGTGLSVREAEECSR